MILKTDWNSLFEGEIYLPSSKSYSIRAFIIAACGGRSKIIRPSNCDDAKVALRIAKALGCIVTANKDNTAFNIQANKKSFSSVRLCVNESGTVLRFLLPLICLKNKDLTVIGTGTLQGRPNAFLTKVLRKMGADINGVGDSESVPIKLKKSQISGGDINIDASLSSQFISALLITCPQLNEDTNLNLTGKLVSKDYIVMTLKVLEKSGIAIKQKNIKSYLIKGNQEYK